MNSKAQVSSQRGAYLTELAMVLVIFMTLFFTILEVSRALYMWNTLQEVTRRAARAAAVTDFSDVSAMNKVRQAAIFRSSAGGLVLSTPVTDQHIRIDYLSIQSESNIEMKKIPIPNSSLPGCPARNVVTCTAKSGDPSCIRLVRVRICKPGADACEPIPYETIFPIIKLPVNLPKSETIAQAESLGYLPGMALCK